LRRKQVTRSSKDKDNKKNDKKGKLRVKDLETKKDPKGGPIYKPFEPN
jgi:hypothetical protein